MYMSIVVLDLPKQVTFVRSMEPKGNESMFTIAQKDYVMNNDKLFFKKRIKRIKTNQS